MSHSDYEYLKHILQEIDYVLRHTEKINQQTFLNDESLKRAVARSLKIIGETTKKVNHDFRSKFRDVPWRSIAGMQDRLCHDYFVIDYEMLWDVTKKTLPELQQHIIIILHTEEE